MPDLVKNVSKENKTRLKRGILSQLRFLVQGGQRTLPVLIPSFSRYGNNIRFVFEMDVLPELFIDHRIFVNIKLLSFTNFLKVLLDVQPLQLENGVLPQNEMLHGLRILFANYKYFESVGKSIWNPVCRLLFAILVREVLWAI